MSTSLRTGICLSAAAFVLVGCGGGGSNSPAADTPPSATNTAPRISSLPAAQSMAQDSSSELVAFDIADTESDPGTVSVAITSSNPELLPPEAVQTFGNGSSRSLLLTPMDGVGGSSTITITATDSAGLSSQQSMEVAVTSKQQSFKDMVATAFAKDPEGEPEETVGFSWTDNPEEDDTAFDKLTDE